MFSTCSGVPASAVTVIASRSTATIPLSRSGRSIVCPGVPMAVKLWPVPTILTVVPSVRARSTAATTASVSPGWTTTSGCAASSPDQFLHSTSPSLVAVVPTGSADGERGIAWAARAETRPAPAATR